MKAEIKEAWLKALRSGEYKQCSSVLVSPGEKDGEHKYCCLGVLACVLGAKPALDLGESMPHLRLYLDDVPVNDKNKYGLSQYSELLSDDVLFRVGSIRGSLSFNQEPLSVMNDKGISFSEIADYIEKNVPAY